MLAFTQTARPLSTLRRQYLAALDEPQEWFLEELVGLGTVWAHEAGTYGVINEQTLVEFVSAEPTQMGKRLHDFQYQNGFSKALVKSYDHDLVRSFIHLGWAAVVGGILFRKRVSCRQAVFDSAQMRAAISTDVRAIWQINDAFFDSEDEVANLVSSNKLWTVTVGGEIVGCGITNRVAKNCNAVDVGMMVAKNFRRKGLGTYIVNEISNKLEAEGLRPICGCGASNVASRATLVKAGFVSEHELLSFTP